MQRTWLCKLPLTRWFVSYPFFQCVEPLAPDISVAGIDMGCRIAVLRAKLPHHGPGRSFGHDGRENSIFTIRTRTNDFDRFLFGHQQSQFSLRQIHAVTTLRWTCPISLPWTQSIILLVNRRTHASFPGMEKGHHRMASSGTYCQNLKQLTVVISDS